VCVGTLYACIGTPNPEIIISLDAGGRRVTVRVFHPRQNAAASYLTRSAQYTYTLYISRRLTNSVSLCPSLASRFMALIFILDALFTALSRCVGERVLQMKWWGGYDVRANLAFWQRNKLSKTPPSPVPRIMYARDPGQALSIKSAPEAAGGWADLICEYIYIYNIMSVCVYNIVRPAVLANSLTLPLHDRKLEARTPLQARIRNRSTIIIIIFSAGCILRIARAHNMCINLPIKFQYVLYNNMYMCPYTYTCRGSGVTRHRLRVRRRRWFTRDSSGGGCSGLVGNRRAHVYILL